MRYFTLCLITLSLFAGKYLEAEINSFSSNPLVSENARSAISPYIMADNHPMRKAMDELFGETRVTQNETTLTKAGFTILHRQPRSCIRVVSHPKLPGYLVKLVLDEETRLKQGKPEWHWFSKRCELANKIREVIQTNKIKYFTVPKKCLYPLPATPEAILQPGQHQKLVVLLVEDMKLTGNSKNLIAWKNSIKREHLDELYLIIKNVGGSSYRADNIPLTKNGIFAFIDTEYPNIPSNYSKIDPFLSKKMRSYWLKITHR